jgi:NAD(P)-dependent dehydrogenase (short-subunit alcohol dehydrogenase family)
MISYDLRGQRVLITGAASGIGLAAATRMCSFGAKVAVNYLPNDERGISAIERLKSQGYQAVNAPGDVSDLESSTEMVNRAVAELGGLDVLVNNAGVPGVREAVPLSNLDAIGEDLWRLLIETNLLSVFRCSKLAAPHLKASKGGIVNVSSISGLGSSASSIAYAAAKAGVVNLTKNLAKALAPEVRVNSVAPGQVESAWPVKNSEDRRADLLQRTPLKRFCTADDIADVILFLSFGSPIMTGSIVVADAGLSL